MELGKAKITELLRLLEKEMWQSGDPGAWGGLWATTLRAELKKRAVHNLDLAKAKLCEDYGEPNGLCKCAKCGRALLQTEPITTTGICCRCYASRPDAPKGYEFVAWRRPLYGEYYLTCDDSPRALRMGYDGSPCKCDEHGQGKRWILRKVQQPCPKCGETYPSVEHAACSSCWKRRPPVPPGFKILNQWRPPKKNEYYLDGDGTAQQASYDFHSVCAWILRKKPEDDGPRCCKCDRRIFVQSYLQVQSKDGLATIPCDECQQSHKTAQAGYEYTGEWREVEIGEYYLSSGSPEHQVVSQKESHHEIGPIDQGRRWILKKLPDDVASCPKCGGSFWAAGERATRPCNQCIASSPDAPPGFEHVGEWRPPKKGEYYFAHQVGPPTAYRCVGDNWEEGPRWILRKVEGCVKCGRERPAIVSSECSVWICPPCNILRKVEEAKFEILPTYLAMDCPSCGRMRLEPEPGTDPLHVTCEKCGFSTREPEAWRILTNVEFAALTRRVEELEKKQ